MSPNDTLRGLFICSIFPTPARPNYGLVNAIQLRALAKHMQMRVLSPHPCFPFVNPNHFPASGGERAYDGIPVKDMRTWYVPLSRGAINGWLYGRCIRPVLADECASFCPDFLLTSFAFPDGVGVSAESRRLNIPWVAILRGTDIHGYSQMPARWRSIVHALQRAFVIIARSRSLAEEVIRAGIAEKRVHVIHNGVDHETFGVRDRDESAKRLGLAAERRRVLFVGSLLPVKSVPTLVEACAELVRRGNSDTDLVLIGEGPERDRIERLITEKQLGQRVQLLGEKPHSEVALWMSASDLICLPSRNEGIPNVILEAFACGKPVVASCVGGIPEVHPGGELGLLFDAGSAPMLADQLRQALRKSWDSTAIAEYARRFSWENNARAVVRLLQPLKN